MSKPTIKSLQAEIASLNAKLQEQITLNIKLVAEIDKTKTPEKKDVKLPGNEKNLTQFWGKLEDVVGEKNVNWLRHNTKLVEKPGYTELWFGTNKAAADAFGADLANQDIWNRVQTTYGNWRVVMRNM